MALAFFTVLLSVSAGAGLAFLGGRDRRHLARVVDAFSLVACIVVVGAHLLPHAISRVGLTALAPFAGALLIPLYFERWAHQRGGDHGHHGRAALEIGYGGLLLHQVGDGLGLGTFASGAHAGHDHLELALAIFAHTVPVAAVVTLAFMRSGGPRSALARAVGLALSGLVGVALAGGTPSSFLALSEPWVTAVVAGLLLHVITHDFRPEGGRGASARAAELVALALGAALLFVGDGDHGHGEVASFRDELARALADLALSVAPATIAGLAAAAVARAANIPLPTTFFEGRDRPGDPGSPEVFFVTLALAVQLFGWLFAAGLALTAFSVALAGARAIGAPPLVRRAPASPAGPRAIAFSLDSLFTGLAPWLLAGLVAAAYTRAGLGPGALGGMGALGVAIAGLAALPIRLAGPGGVPLLFVAAGLGLSPGAALAALVVGPATSVAVPEGAGSSAQRAARRVATWGVWVAAVAIGVALDVPALRLELAVPASLERLPSPVELACAIALGLAVTYVLVRDGARSFVGALGSSLGALPHAHEGPHR